MILKTNKLFFQDGDLEIRVSFVQVDSIIGVTINPNLLMTKHIASTLAHLKLNWLINEEDISDRLPDGHPLLESLQRIKGIDNISIMANSILVIKKKDYSWEPILGRLVNELFAYERLCRRIAPLINKTGLD